MPHELPPHDAQWCPDVPRSESKEDLGFERQPMVDWFDPRQLIQTGIRTLLSTVFGRYFDKRELQAALNEPATHVYEADGPFWFDYVADLGDGWNPTYTVARLLAERALRLDGVDEPLQRGRFLVLGGDQVYPTASRDAYQNRFVGPYKSALPCEAESHAPDLYAIPGNHDWYDELTSFIRLFCQQRWIGGWQTHQSRSYFSIRLPHDVWLWGIDIQMEADIDKPQLDYFLRVAEEIGSDETIAHPRVILCTPEPAWIHAQLGASESYHNLSFFERKVIQKAAGAELILTLAGDLHHYSRYAAAEEGHQKITSGGGGATLAGTHELPEALPKLQAENPDEAVYRQKALFPNTQDSKRIARGVFKLPFRSWYFCVIMGLFFLLIAWLLQSSSLSPSSDLLGTLATLAPALGNVWAALGEIVRVALFSPGGATVILIIVLGFTAFSGMEKWYSGLTYGIIQILLCFLSIWIFGYVALHLFPAPQMPAWLRALAFSLPMIVVAGFVSGFLQGVYLWISNKWFKLHLNEVFASQSYEDYKNFIRVRVDGQGITIYPVGIKRVCKKWVFNKEARPGESWFEPAEGEGLHAHLIEPPIHLPHTPATPATTDAAHALPV